MEPAILTILRNLRLDPATLAKVVPFVQRFGAKALVAMARQYLGPVACEVEARCRQQTPTTTPTTTPPPETPPPTTQPPPESLPPPETPPTAAPPTNNNPPTNPPPPTDTRTTTLDRCELELLAVAARKLVFELGELSLYNPDIDPRVPLPVFNLDANGCGPAMSLAHVLAAQRAWQARTAAANERRRAAVGERQTQQLASTQRLRLQAARSERYATTTRFAYPPPPTNTRVPR